MSLRQTVKIGDPLAEISRLTTELAAMRQRVAQLEREQAPPEQQPEANFSRPYRAEFDADIEFIGDFDIVQARGINISNGGICFEILEPLSFDMRFDCQGEERIRSANLAWMKSDTDNKYQLGFEFASANVGAEF